LRKFLQDSQLSGLGLQLENTLLSHKLHAVQFSGQLREVLGADWRSQEQHLQTGGKLQVLERAKDLLVARARGLLEEGGELGDLGQVRECIRGVETICQQIQATVENLLLAQSLEQTNLWVMTERSSKTEQPKRGSLEESLGQLSALKQFQREMDQQFAELAQEAG
jgi:hypothetical protein